MGLSIPNFSTGKVLVVGDLMLDKYWYGDTKRISPEAPVPIVKIEKFDYRAGGAANVALNMASLGTQVTVIGIMGRDNYAQILSSLLTDASINNQSIQIENIHTITKLRVLSNNQQLIRLDFEDSFHAIDKTALTQQIKALIPLHDVLLISDYDKGTLSDVQALIQCARLNNVPVLVDPKGKNFSRYKGANIITPNLSELEAIIGKGFDDNLLVEKTVELLNQLALDSILITRSEKGMILVNKDATSLQLAAKAQEVYDVTGAGDTVISTLASCLAAQTNIDIACEMANVAAGIVVGKLGTACATELELIQAMHINDQHNSATLTLNQLTILLSQVQQTECEPMLVFGDFDILTAKHVAYIRQLKNLVKQLVIVVINNTKSAINDNHIINTIEDRISVVSALENVDWIVALSEPEMLQLKNKYQHIDIVNIDEYLLSKSVH
jgi:D-beta-D-heptose 7-phosphate kinase/D-beta-D-heptose 1-phosphate adenosyltransferase